MFCKLSSMSVRLLILLVVLCIVVPCQLTKGETDPEAQ